MSFVSVIEPFLEPDRHRIAYFFRDGFAHPGREREFVVRAWERDVGTRVARV
jgi:hypothetical protein